MQEAESFYERLIKLSLKDYYNPFDYFEWPDVLPRNQFWLPPELLTVAGTRWENTLSHEERIRLSIHETVNLFSLTFHGEQNIKTDTVGYVETSGMEQVSDYMQVFLREENSHMYFFSKFCKKYGGKLYPFREPPVLSVEDSDLKRFLVFSQALIAEEAIDQLNVAMMKDDRIPDFIRKICDRHHQDEARHIAMGKRLQSTLWEESKSRAGHGVEQIAVASLARFGETFLAHLYNPDVYRDAGFDDPYGVRRELLKDPARREFHRKLQAKSWRTFAALGLDVESEWKRINAPEELTSR